MGCDIHYVVEQKSKNHGWVGVFSTHAPFTDWQQHKDPIWKFKNRNYGFFTHLANVRCSVDETGPEPKGMPEDASTMAREHEERWGDDGHSHSYCSLHDFAIARLKAENLGSITAKKLTSEEDPLFEYLGLDSDENLDEYRVVFWFDN